MVQAITVQIIALTIVEVNPVSAALISAVQTISALIVTKEEVRTNNRAASGTGTTHREIVETTRRR